MLPHPIIPWYCELKSLQRLLQTVVHGQRLNSISWPQHAWLIDLVTYWLSLQSRAKLEIVISRINTSIFTISDTYLCDFSPDFFPMFTNSFWFFPIFPKSCLTLWPIVTWWISFLGKSSLKGAPSPIDHPIINRIPIASLVPNISIHLSTIFTKDLHLGDHFWFSHSTPTTMMTGPFVQSSYWC